MKEKNHPTATEPTNGTVSEKPVMETEPELTPKAEAKAANKLPRAEQLKKFADNWHDTLAREAIDGFHKAREADSTDSATPIALQAELQELMWEKAGPFRTGAKLSAALARIGQMQRQLAQLPVGAEKQFNLDLQDWFELRAMLTTAKAIVQSALARNESRGAHQREDFPAPDDSLLKNQVLELQDGALATTWIDPVRLQKNNVHYPEFRS